MNDTLKNSEVVSALADGQLRGEEFARAVDAVAGDAQARATWHAYHLVGDVLRSSELASRDTGADFLARLQARLRQEPGRSPSAVDFVARDAGDMRTASQNAHRQEAANQSSFGWKLLAGLASLAAVAAIGWSSVSGLGGRGDQAQLVQAPVQAPPVVVAEGQEAQVMLRDPQLDELLAAHKQFGGTSALQMPAGFLRNATFEGPAR
ncbi:MAG: sigma-E factor negative regulatory protein [Burkholderiaceae bacterium]